MKQPDFWKSRSLPAFLLLPFSIIYIIITWLRALFTTPVKSTTPIICIGNVTIGGAGKTPTSIAIAKLLIDENYKITFLSKGYGGSILEPTMVTNKHNASEVGDEPILLSQIATTIISKNRKTGLRLAEKQNTDFIIMDDGLQNPSLHKDIAILVIDGNYGLGNNFIMPAGPLRQTLSSALAKSSNIIFIGEDKNNIAKKLPAKDIIKASIKTVSKTPDNNKTYIAFAGIANPNKFFNTLDENKYNIIDRICFPDHHKYTKNDIENLLKQAKNQDACLITTAKDLVKIDNKQRKNIYSLNIEINWHDKKQIQNFLEQCKKFVT